MTLDTAESDVLAAVSRAASEHGSRNEEAPALASFAPVLRDSQLLSNELGFPAAWEASLAMPSDDSLAWNTTSAAPVPIQAPSPAPRSHHSKQKVDENGVKRPPRPPNAWILYRSECIQKQRAERPPGARKPTQAELSKLFGEQWRNESEETKGGYERLAEAAREEHAQKYPDWRFSRKPIKQGGRADGPQSSSSPQVKTMKLQVPSENDQAKKRRRNISGASSDDPVYTPDESASSSISNGTQLEGSMQSAQMSYWLGSDDISSKRHRAMPPGTDQRGTQEYFPFHFDNISPGTYAQLLDSPYKTFPQQNGLNSTLAQRNTSAAQFYNMYDLSPRSTNLQARPQSSHAPQTGSTGSFPQSFSFNGAGPETNGSNQLGFFVNDNALPFDQPQLSLPSMPFGMTALGNGSSASHLGNNTSRWSPGQPPSLPPFPIQNAAEPPLSEPIGLDCPEWLYALRRVKVRPDDFAGVPLLDFLGNLHTRDSRQSPVNGIHMPVGQADQYT